MVILVPKLWFDSGGLCSGLMNPLFHVNDPYHTPCYSSNMQTHIGDSPGQLFASLFGKSHVCFYVMFMCRQRAANTPSTWRQLGRLVKGRTGW